MWAWGLLDWDLTALGFLIKHPHWITLSEVLRSSSLPEWSNWDNSALLLAQGWSLKGQKLISYKHRHIFFHCLGKCNCKEAIRGADLYDAWLWLVPMGHILWGIYINIYKSKRPVVLLYLPCIDVPANSRSAQSATLKWNQVERLGWTNQSKI